MELLTAETAEIYLRHAGRVGPRSNVSVERLEGGVSNEVLRVTIDDDGSACEFVLKQARPQLRTPDDWFCTVERIWRETAVLAHCARIAGGEHIPRLVFEDRPNYLFAMTAAPRGNRTWKQDLLACRYDEGTARSCGRLLGRLHAGSWRDSSLAGELGDRQLFDELRLDPYYRTVARRIPETAASFDRAIESLAANSTALVHADFSPKNILLFDGGMLLVDYETGHYGDPAFDLGFFFSHLLLKACRAAPHYEAMLDLSAAAWQAYGASMADAIPAADWDALQRRWTMHLGACLWSRIDGKSQVEYLPEPPRRDAVRRVARELLFNGELNWKDALAIVRHSLEELGR